MGSVGQPERWVKERIIDVVESPGMPSCPVATDFFTNKLRAAKSFGVPIP